MNLNYLPELLSLLPLGASLYLMWREHKRLRSLTYFILAIGLFFVARSCDVLIQVPSRLPSTIMGVPKEEMDPLLNGLSDLSDTVGVFSDCCGVCSDDQIRARGKEPD